MTKLPRITGIDLLRALKRNGWQEVRQEGSHVQLKHPSKPGRVTVASHRGDILNPKTLSRALEQAGLTAEELSKLL